MDIDIAGLNKVVCRSTEGASVSITDGTNTWTKTVASGKATFMIPSMPAPAKKTYTISISGSEYTRSVELGFGDSLDITLDSLHEPAIKSDVSTLAASTEEAIGLIQDQIDAITSADKLSATELSKVRSIIEMLTGANLVSASASGTELYLTSIGGLSS